MTRRRLHVPATETPPAQSRRASLAEAAANVVAGFVVAVAVQRAVYPLFDIDTTITTDGLIATIFTAASLLRSYLLRRLFVRIDQEHGLEADRRTRSLALRLQSGQL